MCDFLRNKTCQFDTERRSRRIGSLRKEVNSCGTHYGLSGSSVQREEALQGMIFLDNQAFPFKKAHLGILGLHYLGLAEKFQSADSPDG